MIFCLPSAAGRPLPCSVLKKMGRDQEPTLIRNISVGIDKNHTKRRESSLFSYIYTDEVSVNAGRETNILVKQGKTSAILRSTEMTWDVNPLPIKIRNISEC